MEQMKEPQILSFPSSGEFREWLSENHAVREGIWLRIFKKGSETQSVSHPEALEEALCFGWIDGQGKPFDGASWLVKMTPRRKNSVWSKRNRELAEKLIAELRMTEHGLSEITAAKIDGRWDAAYDPQTRMEIPEDFLSELKTHPKGYAFFQSLNKANVYAIAWRLQTAKKPELREKRMRQLIDRMDREEKLH